MGIKLGFIGTRLGLTEDQAHKMLGILMRGPGIEQVHHGGEIGADAQVHNMVRMERPDLEIVGHFAGGFAEMDKPKPTPCGKCIGATPLERDKHLLSKVDVLVLAPATFKEKEFGKVWSALKWARHEKQTIIIIWPNGVLEQEN